jgi:hypothetical protein
MAMTPEELLSLPAMAPPEGVEPNFDNPPNRNSLAWFVTTLCLAVSTLCVVLRTYARIWRTKALHYEEGADT